MKGLVLLFFATIVLGVAWQYAEPGMRFKVKKVIRKNLLVVSVACVLVAIAVVFSSNTTVRLL